MKIKFFIFLFAIALLSGCNHGIAPIEAPDVEPGFSGKITFIGNWPNDVLQTVVVLFKDPLIDSTDFNMLNLRFVSAPIPYGSKEFIFSTEDKNNFVSNVEPGEYAYLAVAQQIIPNSFARKAWRIAGVYCPDGDSTNAGKFYLPENTFLENVNITCDFNRPPAQPPGGTAGK